MTEFCSFLVFRPNEISLIHSICDDVNWSTYDIPDPSMRYRFSVNTITEFSQPNAVLTSNLLREDEEYGRLLVFNTTQDEADNIIQLIWAANIILMGFPDQYSIATSAFPLPVNELERKEIVHNIFRADGYFQKFTHRNTLPVALAVAAKAWQNTKLVYAIHKLALSYQTESVTPWSMHPHHGQVFEKHTNNFVSHVGTSVAINLAFSAIEELNLDVKASSTKPRSTSKQEFIWNPAVLEPLKQRLTKAGIDPEKTIEWVTRGDQTEVEIYTMLNTPSDYSDGDQVRDRQVSVPDAINFCEFLRNQMTAHAFSSKTPRLGPYEVYNTQQVARFLILTKCNLWNTRVENLRERYR